MALNASVQNSCKFLSIRGSRYDALVTSATIQITNIDDNSVYTTSMTYNTAGKGSIVVPTANLSSTSGVYEICLIEGGVSQICKPLLLHCDIDCCLTKLTNELLDCACDCPKCASSLAKAQKVFLLLKSASSAEELGQANPTNQGYYTDILSKYKKAKEICDNSCGCDC